MDFAASAMSNIVWPLATMSGVWLILVGIELLWPRTAVSWLSRLRSAAYWIVSVAAWGVITAVYALALGSAGIEPLFSSHVETGVAALDLAFAIVVGNVLRDFFYYWKHRLQHRYFWRYHAVHHSIRELSGISSYHHVSEELFSLALVALPMSFLFSREAVFWTGLLGTFIGAYAHSNTRATLGPLRYLILDPSVHRIHHSMKPEHFGKNFCAFTPLWDVAFGTAYFPAKDEWPETGLADYPEPDTALEWLIAPWRNQPIVNAPVGAVKLEV